MNITENLEIQGTALLEDRPANVRDLQNALARSLILSENGIIDTCDLPHNIGTHQNDSLNKAGNGYDTLKQQLRNYELIIINTAIEDAEGDRKLAAEKLCIGVSSLYRKLEI